MEYTIWGQEYIHESQIISARVKELRQNGADPNRLAHLGSMRLQLRQIGQELMERGRRYVV